MKYSDRNTGVADSKWLSLFTFIIRVLIIIIKVVYLLFTCSMRSSFISTEGLTTLSSMNMCTAASPNCIVSLNHCHITEGTRHQNNIVTTSMRRHVVTTLFFGCVLAEIGTIFPCSLKQFYPKNFFLDFGIH